MIYKMLFCVVVGLCLAGGAYGGYLSIVDLPATSTDAAIGIDPNKTYTHTLDFGGNPPATINGVAFEQGPTANVRAPYAAVSRQGYGYTINDTRTSVKINPNVGNDPNAVADGNAAKLLRDMIYYSSAVAGQGIILTLQDLKPGLKYSVRYYYRQWDTDIARPITVSVDGGPSINIDLDGPGAHYLDYTFLADHNDVTMRFITGLDGQGAHLYGITCEVTPSLTVANLPAKGTDAAIGIDPNKTYTHTFDFGSNPPAIINGVAFEQGPTTNVRAPYAAVSKQGYGYIINDTRSSVKINLNVGNEPNGVADGNSAELLRDMIYYSSAVVNQGIILTLQNLKPGVEYAFRYYFRQWDKDIARPITISVDGGESVVVDIDQSGAHFLDYTFVANGNDVTMRFITGLDNQGVHLYGLTCEEVPVLQIGGSTSPGQK